MLNSSDLYVRRTRRFKVATDYKYKYLVAPNVLGQNFSVYRKNQVWGSDITYIETKQGWMYLTIIIFNTLERCVHRVGVFSGGNDTEITKDALWGMSRFWFRLL